MITALNFQSGGTGEPFRGREDMLIKLIKQHEVRVYTTKQMTKNI